MYTTAYSKPHFPAVLQALGNSAVPELSDPSDSQLAPSSPENYNFLNFERHLGLYGLNQIIEHI